VKDLDQVIQRKPDHLWAYTCRSASRSKLGRHQEAIADLDRALELDPRNEEALNNRGWSHKALGDMDAACRDWTTSRKMGNAEARIILTNNRCK
jgi:Flp pilus assembly protein TadD